MHEQDLSVNLSEPIEEDPKRSSRGHSAASAERLRIGEFVLDRGAGRLEREGRPLELAPQPWQLLLLLLESEGRLVSRESIRERLWPDQIVEFDQCLAHCLRKLRQALGDDARRPSYVETVPRRGLRLLPPVIVETTASSRPSALHEPAIRDPAIHDPANDDAAIQDPVPPARAVRFSLTPAREARWAWGSAALILGLSLWALAGLDGDLDRPAQADAPAVPTAATVRNEPNKIVTPPATSEASSSEVLSSPRPAPPLRIRFEESGPYAEVASDELLGQVRDRVAPALPDGGEASLDLRLRRRAIRPDTQGRPGVEPGGRLEGALTTGAQQPIRIAIDFPGEVPPEVVVLDLASEFAKRLAEQVDLGNATPEHAAADAEEFTVTVEGTATPGEL